MHELRIGRLQHGGVKAALARVTTPYFPSDTALPCTFLSGPHLAPPLHPGQIPTAHLRQPQTSTLISRPTPGCSVAYMGFLMGHVRRRGGNAEGSGGLDTGSFHSAGTSLDDPRHTLRRLFVKEPAALEDLIATTSDGKVRGGFC